MIRNDVYVATLEARIIMIQPEWLGDDAYAWAADNLAPTAPVIVMCTSSKWSAL